MARWTFAVSGSPLGVARAGCFEALAGVLTPLKKYPEGIVSTKRECIFICILGVLLVSLNIDT